VIIKYLGAYYRLIELVFFHEELPKRYQISLMQVFQLGTIARKALPSFRINKRFLKDFTEASNTFVLIQMALEQSGAGPRCRY
jgi:hypothetical protein